jgi:caffeoyl-CoA O-methyltransferase
MTIIHQEVEQYVEQHSTGLEPLLEELIRHTISHHPKSHMLSGAIQGKLLEMISRMVSPSRILEIGTFTGFSALCLAKGLKQDGMLHTIELREEDAATARSFIGQSYLNSQIQLHIGDAKEIIPSLTETWDLVFLDADKVSYIDYYELTLPKVRTGGWILADNVFFHGDALQSPPEGKNGKAIHAFNEHVAADPRTEQVIISLRDGLSVIRKK